MGLIYLPGTTGNQYIPTLETVGHDCLDDCLDDSLDDSLEWGGLF